MQTEPSIERVKSVPIPVTVVAGFLGAGKTTLINHILHGDHGLRIAVVVNDFGSINIDAELISDVSEGLVSLANGCICCVIRTDLISAVLKLADRPERPDHIVIESSGVADPTSVVRALMVPEIWSSVLLDGVISVVDAEQALAVQAVDIEPDTKPEMKLARSQITGGDLILLNKVDLLDAAQLAEVKDWIVGIRSGGQVLESVHCRLPVEVLLGVQADAPAGAASTAALEAHVHDASSSDQAAPGHDNHEHDHGLAFVTWTYESPLPLSLGMLQQVLKHLPKTVFRAKGFVYSADRPHRRLVLQLVGRRATIAVSGSWADQTPQTRLVFIARSGTCNVAGIEAALNACAVS